MKLHIEGLPKEELEKRVKEKITLIKKDKKFLVKIIDI